MKKLFLLLLMLCMLLAACRASAETPEPSTAPSLTEAAPAETDGATAAPNVLLPMPVAIDLNHLDNCTVPVSLEKGDAYVDDEGIMRMKVTVYTNDRYDMVDIAQLQVGDTIAIHQQNVQVTSIEQDEFGDMLINGEYRLRSDDGGVFYEVCEHDSLYLYALGEATVQVSEDFQFTDSSDLDAGEVTFYPGDFLIEDGGIRYPFSPIDTTLVIENGVAIAMNRVYTP